MMCNAMTAEGPMDGSMCVSWNVAMCPWTLLTPHPVAMAIMDLQQDARFAGNVHHQVRVQTESSAPKVATTYIYGLGCLGEVTARIGF